MKAILLAGGKGTRLRPLTIHTPKPIVPIFNRPFLHYQIDLLKQVPEIDEVILSLNYQPRRIEEVFGDGSRPRHQDPLRRRAGAARHRRARSSTPATSLTESVVVFNGDVLTQIDLAAVIRAAPRAQGQGDDRADAGRQPDAPTGWSRPTPTATSSASSRSRSRTRSPCNTINAGIYVLEPDTFDRIPSDVAWSIERSYFPSLIERGETFVAYVYDGYWIDIGTPEKYTQVHRDIMDGRYPAPPFARRAPRRRGSSPDARDRGRRDDRGPVLHRRRRRRQGRRARSGPTRVIGRQCHDRGGRASSTASILWPNSRDRPARRTVARTRSSAATATSAATSIVERRRRPRRQVRRHRLTAESEQDRRIDAIRMTQSRHLQGLRRPRPLSRRDQRRRSRAPIGRGVRRLPEGASASPCRATCALSSPALAAAFIDGARAQGADVVDYGMIATDMLYFAVVARRARRRRADHRVAQSEAVQRHQDGAAARRCR